MLYLYVISIEVSCFSLILLLIRVFVNKSNLKMKNGKDNFSLLLKLLLVSILPIINVFFAVSSMYISTLMKNEKFIKLINE